MQRWRSGDLFLHPGLRPLQFPSLQHFDVRVRRLVEVEMAGEDVSSMTFRWLRGAYAAFRRFMVESSATKRFLDGDVNQQVRTIEQWTHTMRTSSLARPTINSYFRGMRGICMRLTRLDGTMNPFLFVKAPHPGDPSLHFLTPEAASAILTFVQHDIQTPPILRRRNAAILGTMLLAGVRRGELLRLRCGNIDLAHRTITIEHGKGRHGGKRRTVPITSQLHALLSAYEEDRRAVETGVPEFFLGSRDRAALSEVTLVRLFRRISRITGIHVSPHMLRHTFCTLLSKAGCSDRLAREAMGHADIATLRRYQHVYPGELAQEMEKLSLDLNF